MSFTLMKCSHILSSVPMAHIIASTPEEIYLSQSINYANNYVPGVFTKKLKIYDNKCWIIAGFGMMSISSWNNPNSFQELDV